VRPGLVGVWALRQGRAGGATRPEAARTVGMQPALDRARRAPQVGGNPRVRPAPSGQQDNLETVAAFLVRGPTALLVQPLPFVLREWETKHYAVLEERG
jgi:hypothetical protein